MGNTNATDNIAASRIFVGEAGAAHWSGSGSDLANRYIRGTVEITNGSSSEPLVGRIEECSFSEMSKNEELPDGACGVEGYDFWSLGWKVSLTARFRAGDIMPRVGEIFSLNMPEGNENALLYFVVDGEPSAKWAIEGIRKISFSGKIHASMVRSSLTIARLRADGSTAAQTTFSAGIFGDAIPTEDAKATGTLTSNATNVTDADTVTIGSTVYRFKNTMAAAYDVKIGSDAAGSLANLKMAINASGVAGTNYYAGTAAHPTVSAGTLTATTLLCTALAGGTAGNSIATEESAVTLSWGDSTLTGGLNGSDPEA